MSGLALDDDLEVMLKLAREKKQIANDDCSHKRAMLYCALLQVQSSRLGFCSQADCGDCPLGVSGCMSSERLLRAEHFFTVNYPPEAGSLTAPLPEVAAVTAKAA